MLGVADHLRRSGRAKLYELSVQQLMSGTRFLGEWESKLTAIFDRVAQRRSVVYFSDIWNLPTAGVSSNSPSSAWDALKPRVECGEFLLAGEVTDVSPCLECRFWQPAFCEGQVPGEEKLGRWCGPTGRIGDAEI